MALANHIASWIPIANPTALARHIGRYRHAKDELLAIVDGQDSPYPQAIRRTHAVDGSLKLFDACQIARVLHRHRPKRILEIGSFLGLSVRWLLEASQDWNAHVTAVDPNVRHRVFDDPRATLTKLNARFLPERLEIVTAFFAKAFKPFHDYEHYEPTRTRAQVQELVAGLPVIDDGWDQSFDFIFIDGDHGYHAVLRDFAVARSLLNPGGCIVFHDALSWPGVREALGEIDAAESEAEVVVLGPRLARVRKLLGVDGIGTYQKA